MFRWVNREMGFEFEKQGLRTEISFLHLSRHRVTGCGELWRAPRGSGMGTVLALAGLLLLALVPRLQVEKEEQVGGLVCLTPALCLMCSKVFQGCVPRWGASLLFTPLCFCHLGGVGRGRRQVVLEKSVRARGSSMAGSCLSSGPGWPHVLGGSGIVLANMGSDNGVPGSQAQTPPPHSVCRLPPLPALSQARHCLT